MKAIVLGLVFAVLTACHVEYGQPGVDGVAGSPIAYGGSGPVFEPVAGQGGGVEQVPLQWFEACAGEDDPFGSCRAVDGLNRYRWQCEGDAAPPSCEADKGGRLIRDAEGGLCCSACQRLPEFDEQCPSSHPDHYRCVAGKQIQGSGCLPSGADGWCCLH